jgi:hypothetical protein
MWKNGQWIGFGVADLFPEASDLENVFVRKT